MDATALLSAVNEIAESKGISYEAVIGALRDSIEKAYIKYLGGGDDAKVEVKVDSASGTIELAQLKDVVEEVEDDYLQISVEDANEGRKRKKYKVGDIYSIPCDVADLSKVTAMAVKNNFRQKLAEAERSALYEIYKDHIGEMVTGTVEKADDRGVSVSIGRAHTELGRREMIGDEFFRVGDPIKVYIEEVKAAKDVEGKPAHGPQIQVTRSSEGFLKRLFEEEIREVYDGTVLIKSMAREAGVRSKVAVCSKDENIDATGACIGQGGSRITKIVNQLGNGKDKEKLDVVNYSETDGYFICEALRPAAVVGVAIDEPEVSESGRVQKRATAVVKDGNLNVAIGRKGANARLANRLTGYYITILEETIAAEEELEYRSVEEWKNLSENEKKLKAREEYVRKAQEEAAKKAAEEAALAEAEAATLAEETPVVEEAEAIAAAVEVVEEAPAAASEQAPVEETAPTPAPKAVATAKPESFGREAVNPAAAALEEMKRQDAAKKAASEAKEEAAEPASVHTTTTLEDLEKELEAAKEKKTQPSKTSKRPRKITEEEVKKEPVKPAVNVMPVYTQEELDAIAAEEAEDVNAYDEEEDVDYDDYDRYYDDDEGGR